MHPWHKAAGVTTITDYNVVLQEPAGSTGSEQQLSTREATLQQAEAALHTQQQQLSHDKQVQQQQEQSLTATQQQLVEQQQQLTKHEQQLQQQEAAYSQNALLLDEQKSKLQTQEESAAQAVQQQGQKQDANDVQVQITCSQHRVTYATSTVLGFAPAINSWHWACDTYKRRVFI